MLNPGPTDRAAAGLSAPNRGGWLGALSLQGKVALLFGALALGFVLIGVGLHAAHRAAQTAREHVVLAHAGIDRQQQLQLATQALAHRLRHSLLTGSAQGVESFRQARQTYDRVLVEWLEQAALDAELSPQLLRIGQLMNTWLMDEAGPLLEQLQLGIVADERTRHRQLLATEALADPLDDAFAELERTSAARLQRAELRVERLDRQVRMASLLGLLLWLLIVLGCWRLASQQLTTPLLHLTDSLKRVAAGEIRFRPPYLDRSDEVGGFARSLAALQGDVRSLANSNWLRSALTETHDRLQPCRTHEAFAAALLERCCAQTGALLGLAYRWDDDSRKLWFCAGRGIVEEQLGQRNRFAAGQGLVGQCYADRRILHYEGAALAQLAPQLRLDAGSGSVQIGQLWLLPLSVGEQVVAVLELGYAAPPEAQAADFLKEIARTAAVMWLTLSRSLATAELLEVSQAQARALQQSEGELRDRQQELSAANDALRERTLTLELQQRRLQASEDELRRQADQLRLTNLALEERTAALNEHREQIEQARSQLELRAAQLEDASRYKSEFLANMSHELRTPLNSMLILSKALADNDAGNLDAEQIESASVIYDSGRNLLRLINDILDLSKVEAGKMAVMAEAVSLVNLARAMERQFMPVAQSRGLAFWVRLGADAPAVVLSDETRLLQVLGNLLSNAFKFTHEGGVALEIGPIDAQRRARLHTLRDDDLLVFCVRDSGIGIDRERLDRVFLPFEQADGSTSRRYGGTGLGLSIVQGLVGLLGGELLVDSEPGQGSAFSVVFPVGAQALPEAARRMPEWLPTHRESSATRPTAATGGSAGGAPDALSPIRPPELAGLRGRRILVVDDDMRNVFALARGLASHGIEVFKAQDGLRAIAVLEAHPDIDLVLMDIMMPELDGAATLRRIRSQPRWSALPIIAVTAKAMSGDRDQCLLAGASDYCSKPIDMDRLLQMIQHHLPSTPQSSEGRS